MPFNVNGNFTIGGGSSGSGASGNATYVATVATTANINLASPPSIINGYTLVNGNSIVVKNQTPDTGTGNPDDGLYVFNGTGNAMTRLTGYTTWNSYIGLLVSVTQGGQAGTTYLNSAVSGGTLGTTPLLFGSTTSGAFTATGGITKTGSNITLTTKSAVSNQFVTGVNSSGVLITAQPSFSNLSGTATNAQTSATNLNTINTIVSRDASGNFSAGTITANLTGTASGNQALISSPVLNDIVLTNGVGQVIDSGKQFTTTINSSSTDAQVPTALSVNTAIESAQTNSLILQGNWDASTNTPTLTAGIGTSGYAYFVSVAGTQTAPSGISTNYSLGQLVYYAQNDIWNVQAGGTGAVSSVNGYTGIVSLGIANMNDVTESSLLDAQVLVYNSTASKYANKSLSGAFTIDKTGLATLDTVPIAKGGTGQTTATTALNALLPSQAGNSGKVLGSNGTNASWVSAGAGVTTPENYIQVAINGTDGEPLALTIDNGLSQITTSGEVEIFGGTFAMPTLSLNNKSLIGIDKTQSIIEATANILPVSDNDTISLKNIKLTGTADYPSPVYILSKNGINFDITNCDIVGYDSTSGMVVEGSWNGIYNIKDSAITYLSFGNIPSGATINISNFTGIIDMPFGSTQATSATINIYDSNLSANICTGGKVNIYNTQFTADSNFTMSQVSDNLYMQNCSSRIANSLLYNKINFSGVGSHRFINCDFDYSQNTMSGAYGLVQGLNNKVTYINTTYYLKGYDCFIFVDCSLADVPITLLSMYDSGTKISNQVFTFVKTDNSTNKMLFSTSNAEIIINSANGPRNYQNNVQYQQVSFRAIYNGTINNEWFLTIN